MNSHVTKIGDYGAEREKLGLNSRTKFGEHRGRRSSKGAGERDRRGVIVNVNRSPVTQINIRVYPVDNRSAELARGWHADNYERDRKSLVAGGR